MQIMIHLSDSFKELEAIDVETSEKIYDVKQVQKAFGNKIVDAINDALMSHPTITWNTNRIMFDVAFSEHSQYSEDQ